MEPERVEVEVSVEQEIPTSRGGASRRLRVAARTTLDIEGEAPPGDRLASLVRRLREEMDRLDIPEAVPPVRSSPGDRPLAELIEAYHPRQPELIGLLREEGEISSGEYEVLLQHFGRPATTTSPAPPSGPSFAGEPPLTERPIAAAPLALDRTPSSPRPVDELVRTYRIESIKQAGAVRARRQISYEEYMALKRHFQSEPPVPVPPVTSEAEASDRRE